MEHNSVVDKAIIEALAERTSEVASAKGSCIIIFQGIPDELLPDEQRYFSFTLGPLDLVDRDEISETVVKDILRNQNFLQEYLWMSAEEYQLFRQYSILNKVPVVLIPNNIYDKQFPYRGYLSDMQDVYQRFFNSDDQELLPQEEKMFQSITAFYPGIDYSNETHEYYVTYPEFDEGVERVPLFKVEHALENIVQESRAEDSEVQVELGDVELPFLDLTEALIEHHSHLDSIRFIMPHSAEELPFNYLQRIALLRDLFNFSVRFSSISLRRKEVPRLAEYQRVLQESFGYSSFKEIDFYENIQSKDKETVKISQAQIIDDIVSQAEAALDDKRFRDIFVTASTGAGKSLIFQVPALYLVKTHEDKRPLTLVISPLIGLMQDQVAGLKSKGIDSSATINGNTLPYEREQIIQRIGDGSVDVLYLSPETLQARGDIRTLIGERRIGVVIVDEAHIVTTWGRSFRADYWYLGIYLAKLRKEHKFPIVTFTATAIYGGKEDMFFDTCNSLNLINPIAYFGKVRRNNILMNVRAGGRELDKQGRDYRQTKNALALAHLKKMRSKNKKTLMYFPTVRLLREFHRFMEVNDKHLAAFTGEYYGSLSKEERDETLNEYRSGEIKVVLATKAFGMGIDIPDIASVYHYAPTGTVVDYVQEIGRAARDTRLVPVGLGSVDYLPKDLNDMKKLFGMSAIRKDQILEVMKKIRAIYKAKGNNRNLTISPEDFKYIFVKSTGGTDEDELTNKVKTILLMIEKDFSSPKKLGYSPFVARPRNVFGRELLLVTEQQEEVLGKSRLASFFSKVCTIPNSHYSAVLNVNLVGIWEKHYRNMTYPSFKYSVFNLQEREKLQHASIFKGFVFASGIGIELKKDDNVKSILAQYRSILEEFRHFIDRYRMTEQQFTVNELGSYFAKALHILNNAEARAFAQVVINSVFEVQKQKNMKFLTERETISDNSRRYTINQDISVFISTTNECVRACLEPSSNFFKEGNKVTTFLPKSNSDLLSMRLSCLGIGEAKGLFNYQLVGGNDAQIYIRVNSVGALEKAINQGENYQNLIMNDVRRRHSLSVRMLQYLFSHPQPQKKAQERITEYSQWFWEQIENYFLGIIPPEVEGNL